MRFFVIGHVFARLPIGLRHFAQSVSKKRRNQKEQDLQRTLPERRIWSPHERGRKESRVFSKVDQHSRKARRLYSGYECLRDEQGTCRREDHDRMGQIPGYFFARNSFRNVGGRSTRDPQTPLSIRGLFCIVFSLQVQGRKVEIKNT